MGKIRGMTALWIAVLIAGCGPNTIFVRPGLDTPSQHVANGHQFLRRGKLDDACREFNRAKELDPRFVRAYVGLAVALTQKGDLTAGMSAMDRANQLASSPQEKSEVRKGYDQLNKIKHKDVDP